MQQIVADHRVVQHAQGVDGSHGVRQLAPEASAEIVHVVEHDGDIIGVGGISKVPTPAHGYAW